MDLKELLRKRAGTVAEARKMLEAATTEERKLSDEEKTKYDGLIATAEGFNDEIAQRQALTALESLVDATGTLRVGDALPHQIEKKYQYSLLRAINKVANHQKLDGLEGEVSAELEKRRGQNVRGNGFVLPLDLPMAPRREQRSGFDTTAGAGGIPTILADTYIDILRNRLVVNQAGAKVLTNMVGNFSIPRQSGTGTTYWVAEGSAPTASNQTVDQVPFTPKTVGAFTDISRRLTEQMNTDAEMFVRDDLAIRVAIAVDLAALNGSGTSNQPKGILQNTSVPVVAIGTNGGPPTWAQLVGLETSLASLNAEMGSMSYVVNAVTKGKLKTTPKIAASPSFPVFLIENNEINGYPFYTTNQLPSNLTKGTSSGVCSAMIFGNWADLVLAFWSGQDIIVDPYTGSSAGTLRIVVLQDVDVNVRHPESFAVTNDLTTT